MSIFSQLVGKVILVGDGAGVVTELLAHLHHPVPPVVCALVYNIDQYKIQYISIGNN